MTPSAKLLRRTALVLAGLLAAGSAAAFTFIFSSGTGMPIKWPAGNVPIRIMLGTDKTLQDGSTYNSSAQAAAATWNTKMGSVQFTTTTASGTATSGNGVNEIVFADNVFGKAFDTNVLAVTTTYSNGRSSNERAEGDIVFNTSYTWDSYRGVVQSGKVDLQRVAIHEMGHLLGLDHPDEVTPTKQAVAAIMNSRVSSVDTLTDDDIQGVQAMYGPPGVPANNNFANATVITLTNGSTTVTGYNTNATKETGEPNHAGNSGGRSVWWKWTAPAGGTITIDTGKAATDGLTTDILGGKSSYFDTTLAVYTGTSLSALTAVASDDDISDGKVQVSTVTFTPTAGTTYYIAVDGFNGSDGNGADNGSIKLNLAYTSDGVNAPIIVTQPVGTTIDAGGSATLSVSATGTDPLSYQWLFNGTAITGATSSSYTISNAKTTDGGSYSVTVSNAAGSVTSNSVTLTVRATSVTGGNVPTTSSGGGGGGGGGGAPSGAFLLALSALALLRGIRQRRR